MQASLGLPARPHALTILAQGDQTGVDGQAQLHGQLGRDDARDDENTVEEELALGETTLNTWCGGKKREGEEVGLD